ncbi:MAG: 2-amino-4-hydroxy-6-hydroxymethyldihydropteridine diphosphokinase [Sphingobacteriaceae bacterium]|nr:2-amino-4-hydroxy-6-hydroxymethyldihydropteridine diphosphokinase [Sphingobacteriaceae bacterium]
MELEYIKIYLLLGGNIGEREKYLNDAVALIKERVGIVFAQSSFYQTAAWGKENQPDFLNQAIGVETNLSAIEVLKAILKIESDLGRIRKEKWGERVIDIDLIFYGDQIIDLKDVLQVPHPFLHQRKFVLMPLQEIAPHYIHPQLKVSVSELLDNLKDDLEVLKV